MGEMWLRQGEVKMVWWETYECTWFFCVEFCLSDQEEKSVFGPFHREVDAQVAGLEHWLHLCDRKEKTGIKLVKAYIEIWEKRDEANPPRCYQQMSAADASQYAGNIPSLRDCCERAGMKYPRTPRGCKRLMRLARAVMPTAFNRHCQKCGDLLLYGQMMIGGTESKYCQTCLNQDD